MLKVHSNNINCKKKIIFINNNLNIGGLEKSLVILLNNLNFDVYEVKLLLENKNGQLLDQLDKRIIVEYYFLSTHKNIIIRKFKNLIKRIKWTFKNYNKYTFSCNYTTYSVIGSKLARIASSNTLLYIHSDYYKLFKENKNEIKKFFKQIAIQKFKNIAFVSNESFHNILKIFPGLSTKFHVINNLIDYKNIIKLSQNDIVLEKKIGKTTFLFLGRLEEDSKNITRLIRSFYLAKELNKNIMLWIIGDGKDKEKYEQLILDYQMQSYIKVLGQKMNPYPYIKKADAIVLTSDYEGFPVVYNEALILNKPIFTTIPASDDIIDIKKYAVIMAKNEDDISSKLSNFSVKNYNNNINFEKINKKRIKKIESIIENIGRK